MIEIFVCLFVWLFASMLEWFIKIIGLTFKAMFWVIALPLKIIFGAASAAASAPKKSYSPAPRKKYYDDPIEKAMDRFENHPEDMDLEDEFWIDEILGDDD